MRTPVKRTIYENYDLWGQYAEDAKTFLLEQGEEEPMENAIWEEVYERDEDNWREERLNLEQFFNDGSTWILTGAVELWHGKYPGGFLFTDFSEMLSKAGKDCEHFHFYDENGHFYLTCSHYDGTNQYEIRKVTETGERYYENWNYGPDSDKRTEQQIHEQIVKRYSVLPRFAEKVYGCPKTAYEKTS